MEDDKKPASFDIAALDLPVLLGLFIDVLSVKAWQCMGLRVKPGSEKVEKDLDQARTAIDCVSFLMSKLDPHIKEDEKVKVRALLADLQINFAKMAKP